MFSEIPNSHLISKIPISNGVRSQDPNFFHQDPKIPNTPFRALLLRGSLTYRIFKFFPVFHIGHIIVEDFHLSKIFPAKGELHIIRYKKLKLDYIYVFILISSTPPLFLAWLQNLIIGHIKS